MDSDDLDKQLDKLMAEIQGPDQELNVYPSPQFIDRDLLSSQQVAAQETLHFLKNQYKQDLLNFQDLLELKEKIIGELNQRLGSVEKELSEVKTRYLEEHETVVQEILDTSVRLEESRHAMTSQKQIHSKEIELLQQLAERTRQELKREEAWRKKLQEEWAQKEKKVQEELGHLKEIQEARTKLESQVHQAKEAVEKTVGELLSERRTRAEAEEAKKKALERVQELESKLRTSQETWEAERAQWKELWERERSTWETQKQEFSQWEEKLRKEREEWMAKMQAQEAKEIEYASNITHVLKEASEWSSRVSALMKIFATQGVKVPVFFKESLPQIVRRGFWKMSFLIGGALVVVGLGLFGWHRYHTKVHWVEEASFPLQIKTPTALMVGKDSLWIADWELGMLSLNPQSPSDRPTVLNLSKLKPYHPTGVALGGDSLWSLDAAQIRILRHPLGNLAEAYSYPAPGSAPSALAYGQTGLWLYDASTKLLYRFGLDPGSGVEGTFQMPSGPLLNSIQWVGSDLWGLDTKGKLLWRLARNKGIFSIKSSQKFIPDALSFSVQGKFLWVLISQGQDTRLKRYRLK
ncbi:MAG: hypothetical protein HY399_09010 [Elusimicrobia bacterium]|nr:hypothetical protein [Elusimicrobiota bacterium]